MSENEIEITPEMKEAGAKILANWYDDGIDEFTCDLAAEVFSSMISLSPFVAGYRK